MIIDKIRQIVDAELKVNSLDRSRRIRIVEAKIIITSICLELGMKPKVISTYLKKDRTSTIHYMKDFSDFMQFDKRFSDKYKRCYKIIKRDVFPEVKELKKRQYEASKTLSLVNYQLGLN